MKESKRISLICLEERSTLETVALRGALEYMDYIVSVHWVGSEKRFTELLSDKTLTDKNIILSGHGYEDGFLLSDNKIVKPGVFKDHIAWPGKNVLSLGCKTGTEEFIDAFKNGEVETFIAPKEYPDASTSLVFVIHFFLLLKKGGDIRAAFEGSKELDKELDSFTLYERTPSS